MFSKLKKDLFATVFKKEEVDAHKASKNNKISNPLGLTIGSQFTIKSNAALIYKSFFKKESKYCVVGIGVSTLMPMTKMFRFYLNEAGKASIMPTDSFLQIIVNERTGQVIECRIFSLQSEDFPRNNLTWKLYVGEEGSKIGNIVATCNNVEYTRLEAWSSQDGDWSPERSFKEDIVEDNDCLIIDRMSHDSMVYGRWLHEEHGVAEYLLFSSDAVQLAVNSSLYSTNLNEVAGITQYVGIDISTTEIDVMF